MQRRDDLHPCNTGYHIHEHSYTHQDTKLPAITQFQRDYQNLDSINVEH